MVDRPDDLPGTRAVPAAGRPAPRTMADLHEAQGRAGYYAMLRFSEDTSDPERGALMMKVQERSTSLATRLVFFELEWAELDDDRAEALLSDPGLDFCAHHLRSVRRYREHLLSEPEEKLLTEKSVSGAGAWVRLFDELTSAIQAELPSTILESEEGGDSTTVGLEQALSMLQHPDREVRRTAAEAVTAALEHYTATLAEVLLGDDAARAELDDDEIKAILLWHAVEESEHKAVAFDVFQAVSGDPKLRARAMNMITVGFLATSIAFTFASLAKDRAAWNPVRLGRSLARLRHSPWLTREVRHRIRDYNRPDFHPSDHDATELLEVWRERLFGDDGALVDRLAG